MRVDAAGLRLKRARGRFLANPVNLLLPFTAGVISGALALGKRPKRDSASEEAQLATDRSSPVRGCRNNRARPERSRISITSLISTSMTLWRATASLRSTLLAESAARRAGRAAASAKAHAERLEAGNDASAEAARMTETVPQTRAAGEPAPLPDGLTASAPRPPA